MEKDSEPGSASLPHGYGVSVSIGQCCPPVATDDTGVGWKSGKKGEQAHLVHTSRPDVGSMHPSPRHALVEFKHLDRIHWELVTKSWAPSPTTC